MLAVQLEAITRYSLPLRENIAASMKWYDHEASVRARSWNNPADGVPDPGVVPQRLADGLAEQLEQATRRAARLAAARPGEPSDVADACRQVVAVLARALAAAGHPGAAEMPMASQGKPSRFGKKRAAPFGYLLASREGQSDVCAALDGSLMARSPSLTASIGPIEHAALLYRYAAKGGTSGFHRRFLRCCAFTPPGPTSVEATDLYKPYPFVPRCSGRVLLRAGTGVVRRRRRQNRLDQARPGATGMSLLALAWSAAQPGH